MAEVYYVATDELGVARDGEHEWHFRLAGDQRGTLEASDAPLTPLGVDELLERLDEVIYVAEPGDNDAVRLGRRTAWDTFSAARFAIECAEHAIGGSRDVQLPNGSTLGEILADAKRFVDASASEDDERRLGRLAQLATARRLRRSGGQVGDLARAILAEDVKNELDASTDPAWLVAASIADAVLAAVEALRHLALPRYVSEREEVAGVRDDQSGDEVVPRFFTSPWGDFAVGAEHDSPYTPASHLAREASFRARESVREQSSDAEAADERSWQATLLASLLDN